MAVASKTKKTGQYHLIEKIEIRYFRSLYKTTVKAPGDLNLVFGRNDSGKSNFLRALNLFFCGQTDPEVPLDFKLDFSDIRRKEARDAKGRQFISVRVDFNIPDNFQRSLGKSVSIKRQWNLNGQMSENLPKNLSTGARIQLTKFLNQIDYTYIPAIKDLSVFGDLIKRMYDAAAESEGLRVGAEQFIKSIQQETQSLAENLSNTLGVQTNLAAPSEMGTLFRTMDFSLGEDRHSLLLQKGDGIKARHIPELLRFINENEVSKKFFVWGFEEPENSLDIASAMSEARNFANIASRSDTQIFISSHSPAFYLAEPDSGQECSVKRFFLTKQGRSLLAPSVAPSDAISVIESVQDAEKKMGKASLNELPFMIRKLESLAENIRRLEERAAQLESEIDFSKPAIFLEGESDRIVFEAALKTFHSDLSGNLSFWSKRSGGGDNYVFDMLSAWRFRHKHDKSKPRAVGIIDSDVAPVLNDETGKFENAATAWNQVPGNTDSGKMFTLKVPEHLHPVFQMGFRLPIVLETYYPLRFWETAEGKGWLQDADLLSRVPKAELAQILDTNRTIHECVPDEFRLYISKKFKTGTKIKQAKIVAAESVLSRLSTLASFKPILDEALVSLKLL